MFNELRRAMHERSENSKEGIDNFLRLKQKSKNQGI